MMWQIRRVSPRLVACLGLRRFAVALGLALVLTPLLGMLTVNAASATPISPYAPPDATHTIPYTYQGMVYYKSANGLTATGATIEDTALDPTFHPAAQGVSYGPTKTVPDCAQPPVQGGPVDRATYTDAQLTAYGLPTWADFLVRGNTNRAEWAKALRTSGTRLCDYRSLYQDGQPVIAGNATIGVKHSTKTPAQPRTPAMPVVARRPSVSACFNAFDVQDGHWWGWQSDSTGSFSGAGCPEYTYYPYTAMEGYVDVPNWNNGASQYQNVAGWLGRGGWNTSGCQGYDTNSLIQAGFIETTWNYLNLVHQAYWENTGSGSACGAQAISGWNPNGGDELYIILGCGGYTDCNYVHIEDQTQGASNHYFTAYVAGPAADMHSASCMYELTQTRIDTSTPYDILYYYPTHIWYCRATHYDTSLGVTIEQGVGEYNPSEIITEQINTFNWCGWPDVFSNPNDPSWPNSTFTMERDNNNSFCNMGVVT